MVETIDEYDDLLPSHNNHRIHTLQKKLNLNSTQSDLPWRFFSIIGGLIYGYNVGLGASLQYIHDELQLTDMQEEFTSAAATLSDATSMVIGGYLADYIGRRSTIIIACCFSIFGTLNGGLFSYGFTSLVVWRLCVGVGNGLSILALPMYISEVVSHELRGSCVSLFQLGVASGCALPYIFMLYINESWRWSIAVGCLPAIYILYSMIIHFPISPKWRTLRDEIPIETKDITKLDENSQLNESHQSERRIALCNGILLAYVNNCVDASLFYGPEIISTTMSHYSSRDSNLFGLVCMMLMVFSVLFTSSCLINRFSRRNIYLSSLAIVSATFLLTGVIIPNNSSQNSIENEESKIILLTTLAVMNIFSAIGPNTLFVVILSELFQDSMYRAKYMSYCTFAMSMFSLIINGSMLTLFNAWGTGETFLVYGVTYVCTLLFFIKYLPETKNTRIV